MILWFLFILLLGTLKTQDVHAAKSNGTASRIKYKTSGKLASLRHRLKKGPTKPLLRDFKAGRELQHLLPVSIAREFRLPASFIDSARNGIMIPAGNRANARPQVQSIHKTKIAHIKSGLAHPRYNKLVRNLLTRVGTTRNARAVRVLEVVGGVLRRAHKPINRSNKRLTGTSQFVDDLADREAVIFREIDRELKNRGL